jgi:hypothetical protein
MAYYSQEAVNQFYAIVELREKLRRATGSTVEEAA